MNFNFVLHPFKRSLIVLAGLALASAPAHAGKYNEVVSIGDAMPSFENLPGINGTDLSSSELTSDIVVFVSLANHCPWVKGMDADLVSLAEEFSDKSVTIIGISVNRREDDRLEAMKAHAKKYGYNFEYVFDESQQLGRDLGAARTPEYFVYDKERKLSYTGLLYNSPAKANRDGSVKYTRGEPTEFYVSDAIYALLDGRIPETQETKAHGCSVKYEND